MIDTIPLNFLTNTGNCTAEAARFALATDSCSDILSLTSDFQFDSIVGNFFYGKFPIGTTLIEITATDLCNNTATCQTGIVVEDKTQPTITCGEFAMFPTDGNPITFDPDSIVEAGMNAFKINVMDDCYDDFEFSLNPLLTDPSLPSQVTCDSFDFDDPFFIYQIGITVTDGYGNENSCGPINLFITDDECPDGLVLAGSTSKETGQIISEINAYISNDMDTMIQSAEWGGYAFYPQSMGGDYTITPEKNNDFTNGLTTLDLVLIKKHILGIELLDSPYKRIAADANHDENITTFDVVQLKSIILQNWDELPNNTSWRFVKAGYQFPSEDPFVEAFPESIECVNVTENQMYMNFIGVKIGDVNDSASPDNLMASDTRSNENIEFTTKDMLLEKDKTYQIPIYAKDVQNLSGFQFTLDVDLNEVEFLEIEKALLNEGDFGLRFVEEGLITASWVSPEEQEMDENSILFFIKIKAKQSGALHQAISINSIKTKALAYDKLEKVYGIELFFEDKKTGFPSTKEKYILYQNRPNPFSESTEIQFYLPENSDVEVQILDVSGKTIKTFSNHYLLGEHTIELKSSVFPSTGVYIYKLITPSFSASRKMTIIH